MEFLTVAIQYWSKLINLIGLGNVLIYLAGLIWTIELIPQLIKTYRTEDVSGISLSFFICSLIAYIIYGFGNIVLNNWNIVIAHIPSLLLISWMVILIIKYRRKKHEKNTRKFK